MKQSTFHIAKESMYLETMYGYNQEGPITPALHSLNKAITSENSLSRMMHSKSKGGTITTDMKNQFKDTIKEARNTSRHDSVSFKDGMALNRNLDRIQMKFNKKIDNN